MTRKYASVRGALDLESPPMRLYQKAKRLGVWDPRDLDFTADRAAWLELTADERDLLLRVTALFQGGEEAVTADLLPLVYAVAAEGRLEDELILTAWLWEEGKHTEFFRRFLDEVAQEPGDLHHLHGAAYRRIFEEELLPVALAIVDETFAPYEVMPFDLDLAEFMQYATDQYGKRIARIEKARTGGSLERADEEG